MWWWVYVVMYLKCACETLCVTLMLCWHHYKWSDMFVWNVCVRYIWFVVTFSGACVIVVTHSGGYSRSSSMSPRKPNRVLIWSLLTADDRLVIWITFVPGIPLISRRRFNTLILQWCTRVVSYRLGTNLQETLASTGCCRQQSGDERCLYNSATRWPGGLGYSEHNA